MCIFKILKGAFVKDFSEIESHFNADYEANLASLKEYDEAKKYYHGDQLPADVLELINERGQSPIIENFYKIIVDKIIGYKAESIQEVKVSGRQEQDKPLATLLNDLLRVFSQQERFDTEIIKRDKELIFGMAVAKIWIKQDEGGDFHLSFKNIPSSSFIIDKYSTQNNASDARRFHLIYNMNLDEAKRQFGKQISPDSPSFNDYDQRCTIIESWIFESVIKNEQEIHGFSRYVWNKGGDILVYEPVPFLTKSHPFVVCKYQIDNELRWYGLFRNIKPLQDQVNLIENRVMNMMSAQKIFYESGAVLDPQKFASEASLDNAVVEVATNALQQKKIEFVNFQQNVSALSQKADAKLNLIRIISGLNDEALGFGGTRQSGLAMQQRREIGLMGLGEFLKISDEMDEEINRKALNLMMNYFTKEQVFKIVDKKTGERYLKINDPQNEDSKIRVGKFDLIYKTQLKQYGREERFSHWSEIIKSVSSVRPDLVPACLPLMLKDTESPIAEDLEEVIAQAEQISQQNAQQQQEIQKLQFDLEIAKLKAEIAETNAKAEKYTAQAQLSQTLSKANELELQNTSNEQVIRQTANPRTSTGRVKGIDLR